MSSKPGILGILCNWCSYAAADAAGAARKSYPSNLRAIRVMCSGRVDPALVLGAFREGFDGVLICGCHPGDCHYLSGNCKALFRVSLLQRMLGQLGVDPRRVRLEWISAAEGERFSKVVDEVTETIRSLGPIAEEERNEVRH